MKFKASARFIRFSPYKLRPLIDVVRGTTVDRALNVLMSYSLKRTVPIVKMIKSAAANAKNLGSTVTENRMLVEDIRVDQGPVIRGFKAGAMGRSEMRKKRFSHMSVTIKVCE